MQIHRKSELRKIFPVYVEHSWVQKTVPTKIDGSHAKKFQESSICSSWVHACNVKHFLQQTRPHKFKAVEFYNCNVVSNFHYPVNFFFRSTIDDANPHNTLRYNNPCKTSYSTDLSFQKYLKAAKNLLIDTFRTIRERQQKFEQKGMIPFVLGEILFIPVPPTPTRVLEMARGYHLVQVPSSYLLFESNDTLNNTCVKETLQQFLKPSPDFEIKSFLKKISTFNEAQKRLQKPFPCQVDSATNKMWVSVPKQSSMKLTPPKRKVSSRYFKKSEKDYIRKNCPVVMECIRSNKGRVKILKNNQKLLQYNLELQSITTTCRKTPNAIALTLIELSQKVETLIKKERSILKSKKKKRKRTEQCEVTTPITNICVDRFGVEDFIPPKKKVKLCWSFFV